MPAATVVLAADYYLHNFEQLLESVAARYLDIFPEPQRQALQCYRTLPPKSKMLLVRLLSRQGEWFRQDKLHYPEIGDIDAALAPLLQCALVQQAWPPLEIWFAAVTLPELRQLFTEQTTLSAVPQHEASVHGTPADGCHDGDNARPNTGPQKWRNKQQLWQWLQAAPQWQAQLPQWQQQQGLSWLQLNCQTLLALLLLLYFGNRYQDLSQFVLSDLGLQRFEQYPLTREGRAYQSQEELQTALSLALLADDWQQHCQQKLPLQLADWLAKLPPAQPNSILARRRQKLLLLFAREAERQGRLDLAMSLYLQVDDWYAHERLCRCLEKTAPRLARQALITLSQRARNETQLQIAARISDRVNKTLSKLGHTLVDELPNDNPLMDKALMPPTGHATDAMVDVVSGVNNLQLTSYQPAELSLTLPPVADLRVELATLQHFTAQGYEAWFSENSVLCSLFGLAFWDIIFAPVTGVFDNPYQRAPRDMYQPDFCDQRQALIAQRMAQLAAGDWTILQHHFAAKQGLVNDWVNWQLFTEPLFQRCMAGFSSNFMLALFQRILRDPAHYRSGHPDLLLFAADGSPRFIEVKGPGDKLADHQIHWLHFLAEYYPTHVCYVRWRVDVTTEVQD